MCTGFSVEHRPLWQRTSRMEAMKSHSSSLRYEATDNVKRSVTHHAKYLNDPRHVHNRKDAFQVVRFWRQEEKLQPQLGRNLFCLEDYSRTVFCTAVWKVVDVLLLLPS